MHKTTGNWRQIISLKKLDVCSIAANLNNYPFLDKPIAWFNATYPGLVHKCPFTVSDYFFLIFYARKAFEEIWAGKV